MAHSIWTKCFTYLSAKLAASGGLFLLYMLATSGLDLYKWSQTASFSYIWGLFYGYAFCFSIAGDVVLRRIHWSDDSLMLLRMALYILGGALPFLFLSFALWGLFLGLSIIGVICAVIYDGIYTFMRSKFPYTAIVALALLLLFIVLSQADMSVKRQWEDTQTDASYEVSFNYSQGGRRSRTGLLSSESGSL